MTLASHGGDGKNKDQIVAKIRIGSLNKLFAYRYGGCPTNCGWQFPDDDAGLEDLKILLHHYRFAFAHKMPHVMKLRAPWATDKVLEEVLAHPRKWKSERLGQILNFTGEEWRKTRIRIAPVDMSKEERRDYSRILSNGKRLKKRRTKGMKSRAEYLEANNLSRTKPWVAEGISKATWYRRKQRETSLAAIHKNALARPVSSVDEHGSSPTGLPEAPKLSELGLPASFLALYEDKDDPCPFFIPEHIPGTPNLIPYGRVVTNAAVPAWQWIPQGSLAEIRASLGYRQ
jgi:hypothetical protein